MKPMLVVLGLGACVYMAACGSGNQSATQVDDPSLSFSFTAAPGFQKTNTVKPTVDAQGKLTTTSSQTAITMMKGNALVTVGPAGSGATGPTDAQLRAYMKTLAQSSHSKIQNSTQDGFAVLTVATPASQTSILFNGDKRFRITCGWSGSAGQTRSLLVNRP